MKITQKLAPLFTVVALLLALGVAASFWAFKQTEKAAESRKYTYHVIKVADDFLSELRDAETSQRGYVLTGDKVFLAPYLAVRDKLVAHLNALRQLKVSATSHKNLETVAPLLDAKLAYMAQVIELRRIHEAAAAAAIVSSGQGKRMMDSIRAEMKEFLQTETEAAAQHDADFQNNIQHLFFIILAASLLALLFAFSFAYLIYRQTRQQINNRIHLETQYLLSSQESLNDELQRANSSLEDREEKLAVTLNSIGDAVIATDADARITLMNPVAELLTGWSKADAIGRPIAEVFHIINQETRELSAIPVMETLAHGTIQGLANHTVLIARYGSECAISDSCAPIFNRVGEVVGAVLVFRDVTGEYAAQQALRDSTALIQTVLNTVDDGIVTFHANGSLVQTVNPAAERMFGYSAAELNGKTFGFLIPELEHDQPNGSLEYYSASDEARAVGIGREVLGRRKNGRAFPLEIAVSDMWLGGERYFTGVLRDITPRKQAEEALLKAGALQNAIFNSANFSSIATDAKGVIQIFNVGAERMLGYSAADVMNKNTPADISDPDEVIARAAALSMELETPIAPGFEALVFKASRGIEDIYELTYIRKDGSRFPAVVSVTALRDAQEVIIGYLLIGTDNTARKLVEAERTRLDQALLGKNAELEIAKSLAENANLAKSVFLSSMSHELRTPLSAILGFAQLIDSGTPQPTPVQKRSIDQILKAGWYLLELINEILDLALIESGKLSLSLEPISLSVVLDECKGMVEAQALKREISVIFTEIDSPYFVSADRTRLKQVMINLLSNAIKYNKFGGVVTVECMASAPDSIRISVRDTGKGLSPELLSQLFQPFNRLGQEASIEEGTGIGLVVSKRLMDLMGGVIGVESTVDKGSVFWIELALTTKRLNVLPELDATDSPTLQMQEDAHVYKLLYVEDNPANLMLVEDLIARRPDILLLSAQDGISGIALARSSQPNAILMDINLPGISGVEALRILAEDPVTSHIPVVALSANAIPRDIEKGLEAGFFRYLTKPIMVKEFMETLDVVLKLSDSSYQTRPRVNKHED